VSGAGRAVAPAAVVRAPAAMRAADGGATSTELTIAFPAVLLIIMFALQFGLYLHAAQIAEAAAQEAVEAAQGQAADPAAGRVAASALLADLSALRSPEVTVSRSGTAVSSRVTGRAQQLIPGLALDVAATAEGPVERFVPQDS